MATLVRFKVLGNTKQDSGSVMKPGLRLRSGLASAVYPQGTKSTLSTNLTGSNNDLTYSAKVGGTWGNSISVTYAEPSESSASSNIDVSVSGTDITVTLGMLADTAATLSTNLTGTNNDLTYTAKSFDPAVGNDITIAYVDPAGNDQALSVGVSTHAITVNLATGSGGAITSTATQVAAAIAASGPANALVAVANKTGNDGTGVVTALGATNLAGGARGAANTATEVLTAVNADPEASDLVTVALKTSNDGTGRVIALSKTNLASGANSGSSEKLWQTARADKVVTVDVDDPFTQRMIKRNRYRLIEV
jgi:hypothetical protein